MKKIAVLIPTDNRLKALSVTLTSLCFQSEKDFDVYISDQSTDSNLHLDPTFLAIVHLLQAKGHEVHVLKDLGAKGMAHQRQLLLENSESPYSLFLDDDLILEPFVLENLLKCIEEEDCGFVGNAKIGLNFKKDVLNFNEEIEFWKEKVSPEHIIPGKGEWKRHLLHTTDNVYHLQLKHKATPDKYLKYKVAWVGACVLYNTEKLKQTGGFDFWKEIPSEHFGDNVLAQLRVMKKFGGCGVLPSGVYTQTTNDHKPEKKLNVSEYLRV